MNGELIVLAGIIVGALPGILALLLQRRKQRAEATKETALAGKVEQETKNLRQEAFSMEVARLTTEIERLTKRMRELEDRDEERDARITALEAEVLQWRTLYENLSNWVRARGIVQPPVVAGL